MLGSCIRRTGPVGKQRANQRLKGLPDTETAAFRQKCIHMGQAVIFAFTVTRALHAIRAPVRALMLCVRVLAQVTRRCYPEIP